MKLKSIVLILFAALLLAACAAPGSGALAGTSWVLQSLDDSNQVGAALGGQPITLQFTSANEMGGFGGCNSYGGSYRAGSAGISFRDIVSTLMACADENMTNVESAYFQALSAADSYAITLCESCANEQTLTLTGGGHTLVFVGT